MNRFTIFALNIIITYSVFGQNEESIQRLEYFESNPIYVTQLELDEKARKRMDSDELKEAILYQETLNKNIKLCFDTFWNLNDTIIYTKQSNFKKLRKENKKALFFEFKQISEYFDDDGNKIPVTVFDFDRSNKKAFLENVLPIFGGDTSLLNLATGIRKLKTNISTGDYWNQKDLGSKIILIDEEAPVHKPSLDYWTKVQELFPGNLKKTSYQEILKAVFNRDPSIIYVNGGSTFNAEDGTMIHLIY